MITEGDRWTKKVTVWTEAPKDETKKGWNHTDLLRMLVFRYLVLRITANETPINIEANQRNCNPNVRIVARNLTAKDFFY